MAKVTGVREVVQTFIDRRKGMKFARTSLIVGYRASYAIYVHEDLTKKHIRGQAKFLEQPLRQYRDQMAEIVRRALDKRKSMVDAVLEAGRFLLEKSQRLVPVDTGKLKASGYVELEK